MPIHSESEALAEIRRESQDICNRIHSIAEDSTFVESVHDNYPQVPVLPNLRCGAWYTDPRIISNIAAYFKSTDGHYGNWSFNLRRPNLHLLSLIVQSQGIILVDSTRAGKRMPDALSKTIPIWCAVVNIAVSQRYPDVLANRSWETTLYTPPGTVSAQEHAHISARLSNWAESLFASSYDLPRLPHPLRPLWITPATSVFPELQSPEQRKFLPVICVSASKQVADGLERRSSGFMYIQGSGDDHEVWAEGLTPKVFWMHREKLLRTPRSDVSSVIAAILANDLNTAQHLGGPIPISKLEGRLLVGALPGIERLSQDENVAFLLIGSPTSNGADSKAAVSTTPTESNPNALPIHRSILHLSSPPGKRGQTHFLLSVLPQSIAFIGYHLQQGRRVCICCESGTDISVGVALAAAQRFFDDRGAYIEDEDRDADNSYIGADGTHYTPACSKESIRTRLEWIIASHHTANPTRATLKRVNEYFLSSPSFRAPAV